MHPIDITADGIDFSIVRNVTIRMGALPAGESISRKTLVHQTKRAGYIGIGKLAIKIGELRSQQQSLVDHGPTGKRRNIKRRGVLNVGGAHFVFRALANDI